MSQVDTRRAPGGMVGPGHIAQDMHLAFSLALGPARKAEV